MSQSVSCRLVVILQLCVFTIDSFYTARTARVSVSVCVCVRVRLVVLLNVRVCVLIEPWGDV